MPPSCAPPRHLAKFKMEDIHHQVGPAIQQNDVSSNQHVRAIWRWRRQPPLKVFRTGLKPLLEPRRERPAPCKLLFQTGGQLVSLGKSGRKIVLVVVIPSAHNFTIVILIEMFALVVVISFFFVTFSVSMALCQREIAGKQEDTQRAGKHPFCRFHIQLQSEG